MGTLGPQVLCLCVFFLGRGLGGQMHIVSCAPHEVGLMTQLREKGGGHNKTATITKRITVV